jgi:hypothetical protein
MLNKASFDDYFRIRKEDKVRTTVVLDDALLEEAGLLSNVRNRTSLLREALKALIERESAKRLASLGGSEPQLTQISRRQSVA